MTSLSLALHGPQATGRWWEGCNQATRGRCPSVEPWLPHPHRLGAADLLLPCGGQEGAASSAPSGQAGPSHCSSETPSPQHISGAQTEQRAPGNSCQSLDLEGSFLLLGQAFLSLTQRKGGKGMVRSGSSRVASAGRTTSFPLPLMALVLCTAWPSPKSGLNTWLAQPKEVLQQLEQLMLKLRGRRWPLVSWVRPNNTAEQHIRDPERRNRAATVAPKAGAAALLPLNTSDSESSSSSCCSASSGIVKI